MAYDTHEKNFSTLPSLVIWSMTTNTKKTWKYNQAVATMQVLENYSRARENRGSP